MADDAKQIEDKSKPEVEDELAGSEAPLLEHLVELRKRLINIAIALVVLLVVCFLFAGQIFDILLNPYRSIYSDPGQMELIYTAPQEFFFTQIKVAMFGAMVIAFPVIATQIYKFVAPGLYKNERAAFLPFLVASPLLFLLGAAMVYFFFTPMVMWFFLSMQQLPADGQVSIQLLPKVSEYLGLIMMLILSFGLVFQLPVVTSLLVRVDILRAATLAEKRKYAWVVAFIVAAVLTPPDPISQIGLALPTILLYEISIITARMIEKSRSRSEMEEKAAS